MDLEINKMCQQKITTVMLGGSLRIPASFCGIVGLRPSPGIVPRGDALPAFDSLWVGGPMARNVSDLALMLDAMAVLTQHDPLSRPVPQGGFQVALKRARPPRRIGFSTNLGLRNIDPEVARISWVGAQRLTQLDCVVDEKAPDFSGAIDCFQVLRALLFADVRGDLLPTNAAASTLTLSGILKKASNSPRTRSFGHDASGTSSFTASQNSSMIMTSSRALLLLSPRFRSSSNSPLRSREKS